MVLCNILFQNDKLVSKQVSWNVGTQKGAWQKAPFPEGEATQTVRGAQRILAQAAQPEATGLIQGHPIHNSNGPLTDRDAGLDGETRGTDTGHLLQLAHQPKRATQVTSGVIRFACPWSAETGLKAPCAESAIQIASSCNN